MRSAALVSLALLVLPGLAAGDQAAREEAADRGELLYRVHCRSCHGAEARGDGPMAELLKVRPADLSKLAEGNDGKFEREAVHRKIDGREEVRGHGSREMPVWGLSFQTSGLDAAQEDDIRLRIEDLVAYLASIQSEGGSASPDGR